MKSLTVILFAFAFSLSAFADIKIVDSENSKTAVVMSKIVYLNISTDSVGTSYLEVKGSNAAGTNITKWLFFEKDVAKYGYSLLEIRRIILEAMTNADLVVSIVQRENGSIDIFTEVKAQ